MPAQDLRRPASSITGEDALRWLRASVDRGVKRGTNVLRAYLRAAFEAPLRAKGDPRAAAGMTRSYGLVSNPVAGTIQVAEWNHARDRSIS